ncbi:hypothetical protein FB446DRAFT_850293 [Lentinula raphanica]|nr:hypothetical protein FB446DRAFT_850293 [Lentinula raphanica]
MRPATLHFVITLESSVCYGTHCYSLSTLDRTAFGIFHVLTAGDYLTNTSHPNLLEGLAHTVIVWKRYVVHIGPKWIESMKNSPEATLTRKLNLLRLDDMIQFLTLCNLAQGLSILDSRYYTEDSTHPSTLYCHARNSSYFLQDWVFKNFALKLVDGEDDLEDEERLQVVAGRYCACQYAGLLEARALAPYRADVPTLTPQDIYSAIESEMLAGDFNKYWPPPEKEGLTAWRRLLTTSNEPDSKEPASTRLASKRSALKKSAFSWLTPTYEFPTPTSGHYEIVCISK